jgi:alpha-glucosidase
MLGEDLLMAPVFVEGGKEREVYLPVGEWIHIWTNATFNI